MGAVGSGVDCDITSRSSHWPGTMIRSQQEQQSPVPAEAQVGMAVVAHQGLILVTRIRSTGWYLPTTALAVTSLCLRFSPSVTG